MKFICDNKKIADAITGVSRAVASTSASPILQGILLKADGFFLQLTGYDMQTAITTSIEANIIETGSIVLPAKLLGDMIKNLPNEDIEFTVNENLTVRIKSGITEYDLEGLNATEYPDLPQPGADKAFEIDAGELADMIDSTIYAVSTDDKKPAYTGQLFSIENNLLTVVAVDGFRLAIAKHEIQSDRDISMIVPSKTTSEFMRIIGQSGEKVQIDANRRYIVFYGAGYTIISRLIEGDFINYKTVLPEDFKTHVVVNTQEFKQSISRSSVIITERLKTPLRITFGEKIDVRCQTALGRVADEINTEFEGETVEIGFNYRYLQDALSKIGSDQAVIQLSGPLSPVVITPLQGEDLLFLVLPVRFKND